MERGLHQNPDNLKKELLERAKWYAKGFGGYLSTMRGYVDNYLHGDKDTETIDFIKQHMKMMIDLYKTIPMEELVDHPDFDCLSAINEKLPELDAEVSLILKGKTDETKLDELVRSIKTKGSDYKDRLVKLQSELRQYPGYEGFKVKSNDVDGNLWEATF